MTSSTQTKNTLDERLSASRKALETKFVFPATLGVIAVLIVIWIGSRIFAADAGGYWANIFTDGVGIAITVLVLDRLNAYRYTRERKLALFRQAKSRSIDIAVEALDQILHEGWWDDLLEYYRDVNGQIDLRGVQWAGGVNLRYVNLKFVDLTRANLQSVDLTGADLQFVNFDEANLQKSILWEADLQGAISYDANLQYADLRGANLYSAILRGANLHFADLRGSNLHSTDIYGAEFNDSTALPDADKYVPCADGSLTVDKLWTHDTDMTRYTNPEHPDFWEPDWVKREREKNEKKSE